MNIMKKIFRKIIQSYEEYATLCAAQYSYRRRLKI